MIALQGMVDDKVYLTSQRMPCREVNFSKMNQLFCVMTLKDFFWGFYILYKMNQLFGMMTLGVHTNKFNKTWLSMQITKNGLK